MAREALLGKAYEGLTQRVGGDVIECGVGHGGSLGPLGQLIDAEGQGRALYGYDAFPGWTLEEANAALEAEWAQWGIHAVLHLLKGDFAQTLPARLPRAVSFGHVDCNSEEAHLIVLEAVWPRLSKGGVLFFDDWGEEKWPGVALAIDAFFHKRRDAQLNREARVALKSG